MKIKLIAPSEWNEQNISSAETFKIQKVNLPLLAALTPETHAVKIVDEAFVPDDTTEEVDLVGITVLTDLALRAYHIADTYRQRGAKVVLGGMHATVLPDEALQHADAVVIGEAEEVWPKLLSDAACGKMLKIYRANKITNPNDIPIPRRDLCPKSISRSYTPLAFGIETARGCPYDCEFCPVGQVMGRQHRAKAVSRVISEIESIDFPHLFIVDDTLALNRPRAKRLFTEMIPLRVKWVGQGLVSLAEDLELLKLMRRSGCVGLLIGFESVQSEAHNRMRKMKNLRIDFSEAMRRFHGEGIAILGAFVFGLDHENKYIFEQTFEFIMKCRITAALLRLLTPLPGTPLYLRFLREGRLFDPHWWLHGHTLDTLLFQPKGMTPQELLEGFSHLNRKIYSFGAIIKRFFGMTPWKRTALGCQAYVGFNLATRKRYFKGIDAPQPFAGAPEYKRQSASG